MLITPVFCGAAYKNKGIQLLLDAIIDYLPSPVDIGAVVGTDLDDPEKSHTAPPVAVRSLLRRWPSSSSTTPTSGQQTFVRVYSGRAEERHAGAQRARRQKNERIGRILKIHAKEREEISTARTRATSWRSSA